MSLPADLAEDPSQGNPSAAAFWDTHHVHDVVSAAGHEQTLRSTTRMLEQSPWLPAALDLDEVRDDLRRAPTLLVARSMESGSKRRRIPSLILQIADAGADRMMIVVNDGRAARRWRFEAASLEGFRAGLAQLVAGRPALLWPHGEATPWCRELVRGAGSNVVALGEGLNAELGLAAYATTPMDTAIAVGAPPVEGANTHLDRLEAESMHIMREVAAQAEKPVMLYSLGKDSSVMLHLARKAFYPSPPPFPLMHVDTRWKFRDMYAFRDLVARDVGMDLIVHVNPDGVEKDINPFDHGSALHTDVMKTQGLKQALDQHGFDVAFGGARRDEEKSRAKERVFSFRSRTHQWDPKNQRPELWNIYNCDKQPGEGIRVFPLSNWTELDIWLYVHRESIPIVPLYFAAERPVVDRDGMLIMVDDDRMRLLPDEVVQTRRVRFRTLGCYPLSGSIDSDADSLEAIVLELLQSHTSERQGRLIDTDSAASMEKKKQEGYF